MLHANAVAHSGSSVVKCLIASELTGSLPSFIVNGHSPFYMEGLSIVMSVIVSWSAGWGFNPQHGNIV